MEATQIFDQKKYEDFVNMAVHELKTPVTVLKAYLQIIQQQLQKENQDSHLKTVDKMDLQVDKLLNLISDLQDGLQANSENLHCLINEFDINETILSSVDNAKTTHTNCIIEVDLDQINPLVRGDHYRVQQIINNLINNAVKYSGLVKHVKIKSEVQKDCVKVSVQDNGRGIPEDQLQKIFQQFYRVPTASKNQPSGLGLGLFICSEIIRKHDGRIGVNSVEGKGSEFWFSLKL